MGTLRAVTHASDLSGAPATTTVTFTWRGRALVIDLTDAERRAFDQAVAPYVRAARPLRPPGAGVWGQDEHADRRSYLRAVRVFAEQHGWSMPDRRRPSRALEEAYLAWLLECSGRARSVP